MLETATQEELTEHLGYDNDARRFALVWTRKWQLRNGSRNKKVITDACGQVEIDVPRDRNGTFEPVIVEKRQRRITDVDRRGSLAVRQHLTTRGDLGALRRV